MLMTTYHSYKRTRSLTVSQCRPIIAPISLTFKAAVVSRVEVDFQTGLVELKAG